MKRTVLISLLCLRCLAGWAQATYFPDATWQTKRPEDLGLSRIWLDSAVRFAQANENNVPRDLRLGLLKSYANEPNYKIIGPTRERGGPAGVILKNGYIVAQWGDVTRTDMTFSVTKSFLSTVAGLAVDAGLINSVQDTVSRYVWDGTFAGPHNSRITWEHLLNQSSDWSGTLFGLADWADRPPKDGTIDDWRSRRLNVPGTVYKYNDVRVNLLAYSLLNVWRKPLPTVLKERIMDPIGASTTWRWHGYDNSYVPIDGLMMQSVSGGGHHGGGLFISTLDMARFGLLFQCGGMWKGQQLISRAWLAAARQPSPAFGRYGYLWWLNTEKTWPAVSQTVYSAQGYGGNYIIVDDKRGLVIVARWINDAKVGEWLTLIDKAIGR
jgi:CubicO group peptidase (beta-lactamase class C family)